MIALYAFQAWMEMGGDKFSGPTQVEQAPVAMPSMEISSTLPLTQVLQHSTNSTPLELRVGQLVRAMTGGMTPDGLLQLQVGRQELLARSSLSVPPGQALTLQVVRGGPTPELRVIPPPSPEFVKAETLRYILPRMRPVAEALDRLFQAGSALRSDSLTPQTPTQATPVLQDPVQQPPQALLDPNLQQALQQLAAQIPDVQDVVHAPGLKAALLMSGLFAEVPGAQQGRSGATDLKTVLQRIAALLRNQVTAPTPAVAPDIRTRIGSEQTPPTQNGLETKGMQAKEEAVGAQKVLSTPAADDRHIQELSRQVEGALSRIQFNQIVSLPQEDPSRHVWQLDLPVRCEGQLDNFHLQVQEEQRGDRRTGGTAVWSIQLSFDLTPLGPIQARIELLGETVSNTFWAEHPETAALIAWRLGELRSGIERVGLKVGRLDALPGRPTVRPPRPTLPPLLDEHV